VLPFFFNMLSDWLGHLALPFFLWVTLLLIQAEIYLMLLCCSTVDLHKQRKDHAATA
jgi:hypothetical protein